MKLILSQSAAKGLTAMPKRDAAALLTKMQRFADTPFEPLPWAKPLAGGTDAVRIRHGDWRAVCRIDRIEQEVTVDAVAHRREVYR